MCRSSMSSSFNPSFEQQWQLSQAADKIEIFVMEPELYAIVILEFNKQRHPKRNIYIYSTL